MDARAALEELEVFRRTILLLSNLDPEPEVRKVHVYGMRNARAVQEFTGMDGIAGVYTRSDDYPIFVTIADRGFGREEYSRHVTLHEYSHHVLNSHTAQFYPRWYDEGLAEYLGSFAYEDGVVTIGRPGSELAAILNRPGWTDIDHVLTAIAAYPDSTGSGWRDSIRSVYFYGMSWLAVHYIQSTPELAAQLKPYIVLLNEGTDPLEAFEEAFGLTPDEFKNRISRYWRDDAFPSVSFRVTEAFSIPDITVSPISDGEALEATARPRAMFDRRKGKTRGLRRDIEKRLAEAPSGELFYALSTTYVRDEEFDEAVTIGERAVATLPEDPLAIQSLADAHFHRYRNKEVSDDRDIEDLRRAAALFTQQLSLDPTSPTANDHLPAAYLSGGVKPNQTLVDAVVFNLNYRRNPRYFGTYLDAAEMMRMVGATGEMCALLGEVDAWIRAADEDFDDEARREFAKYGRPTPKERPDGMLAASSGACAAGN